MSDLISRERLINEWDDLGRRYAMPTTPIHKRAFREFPSADVRENKGEWIPVNERLPEDYDRVLITVNGCRGLIVREAHYHKARNEFEVLHNHDRWEVGEEGLLAWQPLPEPYKKGE